MKGSIFFVILVFFLFILLTGCSVNNSCYSITLVNYSNKDVTLTYGENIIFAFKGTTVTNYYYKEATSALIKFPGVDTNDCIYTGSGSNNGKTITGRQLKFNFAYRIGLSSASNNKYDWWIGANYVGDNNNITYPDYIF